ncbi:hypothetical protein BD289DRAFT_442137 [Coniella lustricola]|uniref:Secreted protein n=1 Tax=Coniella lustricola TaxID=2025994 RepID=A0A2T2ZYL0_9PEZI|nr:hypothetical protein BD289DRAFT_442137 [Coniella lustricola]
MAILALSLVAAGDAAAAAAGDGAFVLGGSVSKRRQDVYLSSIVQTPFFSPPLLFYAHHLVPTSSTSSHLCMTSHDTRIAPYVLLSLQRKGSGGERVKSHITRQTDRRTDRLDRLTD